MLFSIFEFRYLCLSLVVSLCRGRCRGGEEERRRLRDTERRRFIELRLCDLIICALLIYLITKLYIQIVVYLQNSYKRITNTIGMICIQFCSQELILKFNVT